MLSRCRKPQGKLQRLRIIRRKTEDGRQKTEDGRRLETGDYRLEGYRRRKTEDRRQNALAPRASLLVLLATLLVAAGDTPVPWPYGEPPSGPALDELVNGALDLADLERFEEFLEAAEQGEDREHITVFQNDIDNGLYSDLHRLFRFGDAFFSHEFRGEDGYGDSELPALRRVHTGVRGGLDTFSCAGCHTVGGVDGAGSETQNAFLEGDGDRLSTALQRNPPAVIGLGVVQALGAEMTYDLGAARDNALAKALSTGNPVTTTLTSKGISFGSLTANPDGSVDTSTVEGVSPDLVVRPFGWKGNVARLRRFVEDAARIHFGVQAHTLALGYESTPDVDKLGPGPNWWDPDNDGLAFEIQEGILTATAVYLTLLESPVIIPPHDPALRDRWAHGSALFDSIGCNTCHTRELTLLYSTWNEYSDTTNASPVSVNLLADGEHPRSTALVQLFSDLKRHDMGDGLADPHDSSDGIARSVFLTRPLWGLAESPPYLHDGRAATIPEAIVAHGGEAQPSRDTFVALSPEDQADVHIFLLSFTRAPKVRIAR